jgi:hypothetical protein
VNALPTRNRKEHEKIRLEAEREFDIVLIFIVIVGAVFTYWRYC